MLQNRVHDFYRLLRSDNLSLFYQGITHDNITDKLISLSDENIKSRLDLERIRKRVSVAISECFQNLIRHKENPEERPGEVYMPSMFMIRNYEHNYFIGSANLINKNKGKELRDQLGNLNELSQQELRQLYLKLLPAPGFSGKGGAGLGLIEMARKSKQRFAFDFLSLNKLFSMFFMQLSFCEKESVQADNFSLTHVQEMYNRLLEENVLLLYKSDFSQDGMLPIVDILENNLSNVSVTRLLQKKVMYVLVEMFQNIVKHAVTGADGRQEGLLLIAAQGNGYAVYTGNFVKNKDMSFLKEHLEALNRMDQETLKQLYRKELLKPSKNEKGGAGLGLIETARYSSNRFSFGFSPVDEEISFFTLGIEI